MSDVGLTPARVEVSWFFAASTAAMGLHGQAYDSGGGGGGLVWDEARCARTHEGRMAVGHRQSVVRYGRVLGTMGLMEAGGLADLRLVYEPFGHGASARPGVLPCFMDETRQLLGLVLRTPELLLAFHRKLAKKGARARAGAGAEPEFPLPHVELGRLLEFIGDEVSHLDHRTIRPGHALPSGHILEPSLRAATRREVEAIERYDALRVARVRGEWDAREQYYSDLRDEIGSGTPRKGTPRSGTL